MISIRELINEFGGARAVTLGGVALVFLLVSAEYAIQSIGETIKANERRSIANAERLQAEINRVDLEIQRNGGRFTQGEGDALTQALEDVRGRVARLERIQDSR